MKVVTERRLQQYHNLVQQYIENKFSALIGEAPEVLDSLQEVAAALENDAELVTALKESLTITRID